MTSDPSITFIESCSILIQRQSFIDLWCLTERQELKFHIYFEYFDWNEGSNYKQLTIWLTHLLPEASCKYMYFKRLRTTHNCCQNWNFISINFVLPIYKLREVKLLAGGFGSLSCLQFYKCFLISKSVIMDHSITLHHAMSLMFEWQACPHILFLLKMRMSTEDHEANSDE